jgi:MerR family mercuric resistance operon transcriptional regulator
MRTLTPSRAETLPIGELSKRSGVKVETIRYYERVEMLPAPPRAANGRRVYGATDLRILAFIRRSRELGFSLEDIRALLRLGGSAKASCGEVREIAARHLEDIRAKLDDLTKLERLLAKTVARCSGKTAPDCPVLDILDIRRPKSERRAAP